MRRLWILTLVLAWAATAAAHHSFASIYDDSRSVTLDGVVKEFRFVHPHPVLVIGVDGGEPWHAEMDNRFELAEIGITAATFRAGDRVHISGSPGRKEPRILYLWKLERAADGLRYEQIGYTPYIHWPGK